MQHILEAAKSLPLFKLGPRAVVFSEGSSTGRLYILKSGDLEVVRQGSSVAGIAEPGSVVGDMAVLLRQPHTATVRTRNGAELYVAEDADRFLDEHPAVARHLARELAVRLHKTTALLVDLRQQAKAREDRDMFDRIFDLLK